MCLPFSMPENTGMIQGKLEDEMISVVKRVLKKRRKR